MPSIRLGLLLLGFLFLLTFFGSTAFAEVEGPFEKGDHNLFAETAADDEDEDDEDEEDEPKDPSEIALEKSIDGLNSLPRAVKARMERLVDLEDEFDEIHLTYVGKEAATEALAYRAECQRLLGRSRLAREGYQQYLNLDSGGEATPLALHGLGHCLQDTLEWNRALDQFQRVIRDFSDHNLIAECQYDAGYCLREMGDYAKARSIWETLIRVHGSTSAARKAGSKLGTLRPPIERLKDLHPRWERARSTYDSLPYAERAKGIRPVEEILAEFGDCRCPESEAFLTRLLKDRDKEIQAAAAVPLLNVGGSGVTRTVLNQMKTMTNAGKKKVLDALRPRHLSKSSLKPIDAAARSSAIGVSTAAVELLGRLGDLPATKMLVDLIPKGKSIDALQGQQRQSFERILRALRSVREEAALDWLLDKVLDREKNDLLVRVAVAETLGRAGHKKSVDSLAGLLMHPKGPLRIACLRALALLEEDRCVPDIVRASRKLSRDLEFQQEAVRALCRLDPTDALEMLLALGNHKDVPLRTLVITALSRIDGEASLVRRLEALEDPAWQVRSAALTGLKGVREVALVDALLQAMRRETGSLLPKVVEMLIASTGVDLGPDPDNWDQYWARERDRYDPVAIRERAGEKHGGKTFVRKADPGKARTPSYFGVEIISKRIAFVIDCSGSMAQEVTVQKEGGGVETMNRLDLAKSELKTAIEKLRPGTHFNLVRFDSNFRVLHEKPKKLSPRSVKEARQFVDGLQPGGATNIYDSLEEVLKTGDVDTIFFLSDGAPSAGTFIDPGKILEEISRLNEQSQVTIHTIALGFTSDFMESLAEQNRGSYIVAGQ
jgi:HEAT repeat protein/TolA-binding protein